MGKVKEHHFQQLLLNIFLTLLFLCLSMMISSCVPKDQEQNGKSVLNVSPIDTSQKALKPKRLLVSQAHLLDVDTLTIDKKAAVFYQPDSMLMEKRMNQVGAEDFRKGADDYIYYINSSAEYLENQGLPVLDAKNRKYLKFIFEDRKEYVIKTDTLKELWGMFLFDPRKKPYAADMTIIEDEYKNYYQ
ncbi:MAG TPA: hypothetical protein VJ499_03075 [Flavisolibacter sp.]|nr:hypothetical protein [Flavisolibacter sp.]